MIKNYIPRDTEKEITTLLTRKEVLAIIGPRQAGKTTLLLHIKETLENAGEKVTYITFENREELRLFETAIEEFKTLHENDTYVFIDEFHYAKDGGQKLKYLYDTTHIKFVISGSSSLELTFQTGKYMVGRMFTVHLWPFSFREYVRAKNPATHALLQKNAPDILEKKVHALSAVTHKKIEKLFHEYITFGGYPAVALARNTETKKKVLESILSNYLLRDIKGLLTLATEDELVAITRFLATQIGNLTRYQELSNIANLPLAQVKNHIHILEQTYIIKLLTPYFTNKRTELVKTPKVYFIDTGLRNLAIENFARGDVREDTGALVENIVDSHLTRTLKGLSTLSFWRTKSGAEVDFVIQKGNTLTPIEVKYARNPTIGKSFYSFIEKFKPKKAFILTQGHLATKKIKDTLVTFLPAYYI